MLRAADSVLLERPGADCLDVAALAEVDFGETTFHAVAEHGAVVASQLAIEQRLWRFVVGGGLSGQRGDRQHILRRCQRDCLEAVGIGGLASLACSVLMSSHYWNSRLSGDQHSIATVI